MDVRYKAYLMAEADAVHRQEMARMAQSVAAGFSSKEGYKDFIESLELDRSTVEKDTDEAMMDKAITKLRGTH